MSPRPAVDAQAPQLQARSLGGSADECPQDPGLQGPSLGHRLQGPALCQGSVGDSWGRGHHQVPPVFPETSPEQMSTGKEGLRELRHPRNGCTLARSSDQDPSS